MGTHCAGGNLWKSVQVHLVSGRLVWVDLGGPKLQNNASFGFAGREGKGCVQEKAEDFGLHE